ESVFVWQSDDDLVHQRVGQPGDLDLSRSAGHLRRILRSGAGRLGIGYGAPGAAAGEAGRGPCADDGILAVGEAGDRHFQREGGDVLVREVVGLTIARPDRIEVHQVEDLEIFDLVNLNPIGPRDGEPNNLSHKNITSLALEVPISCLTNGKDPVIGAWTTASLPGGGTGGTVTDAQAASTAPENAAQMASTPGEVQVSRLANPLVNEVIIGLPDKDRFNGSNPYNDAQFLTYVTNPTLPVLLNTLFGNAALAPQTPRNDLVAAFLTGVKGVNQPMHVRPAELMRLNTSIAPTPP